MSDLSNVDASARPVYRRLIWRLMPFLLLCYIVAMIDRLNVGYAKLQFMADLHFNEAIFGMAAGILYIGYIIFEVPSNLMLERTGVRLTFLRIMVLWGLVVMAMAFAAGQWSFYAARFLIGAAEAGFFPGVVFYLTLWFPASHRARMMSLFAAGVPVSGVIAGPLSAWIMTHMAGVSGLAGWQWLFILEGAPAVVLGIATYLYLPNRPAEAGFLNAAEKQAVAHDLAREPISAAACKTFGEVLRRPRTYAFAFVYFAFYSTQSILLLWVPTLLKNSGVVSLTEIGWRAALIFLAGAIGMSVIGWSSDAAGERRWHLIACGVVSSTALMCLPLAAHSPDGTTLCLVFASVTIFSFLSLFWTVPTAEFGKNARAGGIALVSSIGASGSALSPTFMGWMQVLTGSLFGAIAAMAIFFLCAMVALYLSVPARQVPASTAVPA